MLPQPQYFAMRGLILYIGFPLGVFLVHYLFLGAVVGLSSKRRVVALLNMIFYPFCMSLLVSGFFLWLSGRDYRCFISSVVAGVVGYYFSLILAFVPFLAPLFRELDMEFLLLGVGAAMGILHSSPLQFFKALGGLLGRYSFPLVSVFVASLIASTLVKYLISRSVVVGSEKRDILKSLAWVVSISAGVVAVPIIVFFLSLGVTQ